MRGTRVGIMVVSAMFVGVAGCASAPAAAPSAAKSESDAGAPSPATSSGAPAAAAASNAASPPNANAAEANTIELVEAGEEPRRPRRYVFKVGGVERRVAKMKQSADLSGKPGPVAEMTFRVEVRTTAVRDDRASLVIKLLGVDAPGAPRQQRDQIAAAAGATCTFELSDRGIVSNVEAGSTKTDALSVAMQEMLAELANVLVPPLPAQPIGVGAKWRQRNAPEDGVEEKRNMRLAAATNEGATVADEGTVSISRRRDENAPMQMYVTTTGQNAATYVVVFDRAASTKANVKFVATTKAEIPAQNGKPAQHDQVQVTTKTIDLVE